MLGGFLLTVGRDIACCALLRNATQGQACPKCAARVTVAQNWEDIE